MTKPANIIITSKTLAKISHQLKDKAIKAGILDADGVSLIPDEVLSLTLGQEALIIELSQIKLQSVIEEVNNLLNKADQLAPHALKSYYEPEQDIEFYRAHYPAITNDEELIAQIKEDRKVFTFKNIVEEANPLAALDNNKELGEGGQIGTLRNQAEGKAIEAFTKENRHLASAFNQWLVSVIDYRSKLAQTSVSIGNLQLLLNRPEPKEDDEKEIANTNKFNTAGSIISALRELEAAARAEKNANEHYFGKTSDGWQLLRAISAHKFSIATALLLTGGIIASAFFAPFLLASLVALAVAFGLGVMADVVIPAVKRNKLKITEAAEADVTTETTSTSTHVTNQLQQPAYVFTADDIESLHAVAKLLGIQAYANISVLSDNSIEKVIKEIKELFSNTSEDFIDSLIKTYADLSDNNIANVAISNKYILNTIKHCANSFLAKEKLKEFNQAICEIREVNPSATNIDETEIALDDKANFIQVVDKQQPGSSSTKWKDAGRITAKA